MSLQKSKNPENRTGAQSKTENADSKNTIKADEHEDLWLTQYTQWTFQELHSKVYQIVEHIAKQQAYQSHPFLVKWRSLKNRVKYPMAQDLTWRKMKLLLNIEDMSDY
jgi:hypothetical protein